MTENDQQNVERKLNHVLEMGTRFIESYPHITCTERAALLLAMTAAVRQTAANMRTVAALLRQNLLDPFHINYKVFANKVEELHNSWSRELKGGPIFHNLDNHCRPITNPHEIALKEDTDYDFTIRTSDEEEFNFLKTRVGLMKNASLMCEAIEVGLQQIGRTLREIEEDYLRLKEDLDGQDQRLEILDKQYEAAMWEEDKKRFIKEVKMFVRLRNNVKDKETYLLFQDRKKWEATDPHDNKVLAQLNEWFLAGQRPAEFIVENRNRLTMEDLAQHFLFVRCHHLLSQHIESFDLMGPADEAFKDLFVNRAAQELAFQLAPTIGCYVDFRFFYQYAALWLAMQDLDLVYRDRNNGVQMRSYIERAFLSQGEKIGDQKSLTDWKAKLLTGMFGVMDEGHLQGNYTKSDFNKMKDHYWLCLSIINKVVQLDLKEVQFASYLYEEHEKTPSITDYKDRKGESIMDRLFIIKSVIRGETLFR